MAQNLSHIRFGRMQKRFDQNASAQMVSMVEKMTGKSLSAEEKGMLIRGADEVDLVNSGLEETMIVAYHQVREIMNQKKEVKDLRTAAFVNAIQKISNDYVSLGIWP